MRVAQYDSKGRQRCYTYRKYAQIAKNRIFRGLIDYVKLNLGRLGLLVTVILITDTRLISQLKAEHYWL